MLIAKWPRVAQRALYAKPGSLISDATDPSSDCTPSPLHVIMSFIVRYLHWCRRQIAYR